MISNMTKEQSMSTTMKQNVSVEDIVTIIRLRWEGRIENITNDEFIRLEGWRMSIKDQKRISVHIVPYTITSRPGTVTSPSKVYRLLSPNRHCNWEWGWRLSDVDPSIDQSGFSRKERNLHCDALVTYPSPLKTNTYCRRSGRQTRCGWRDRSDPDVAIKAYSNDFTTIIRQCTTSGLISSHKIRPITPSTNKQRSNPNIQ